MLIDLISTGRHQHFDWMRKSTPSTCSATPPISRKCGEKWAPGCGKNQDRFSSACNIPTPSAALRADSKFRKVREIRMGTLGILKFEGFAWLRNYNPVARGGQTILLYHISEEQ